MTETLTEVFEAQRPRLRAVAYRLLGSFSEADDAVQDTWLRLSRADRADVVNLPGWLTTVIARICLDQLRARRARREEPAGVHLPEPVVAPVGGADPEQEALLADAVGVALLVVLETLSPAERLAFVLHDLFGVPFDEIAPVVGRSTAAATQLASRARRRLRGVEPDGSGDPAQQRRLVEAFQAAARDGDLAGLLAVLDPDVVLRADAGPRASGEVRGARAVAERTSTFAPMSPYGRAALVNGRPGIVVLPPGAAVVAVLGFTVRAGRIVEIDVFADPGRLRHVDVSAFG
ncbi:sigma-70 family RNA polymerase sigma factor [Pseudofrankia inefficax]|uniref:RNA polymerase, sigma-24 subunit, ECF subfamily n=1 Tax=Pseudofrankia inefficax (strain DSM 45817 / CECT 9037 / DDB 130130 / EuI1c) TaxID=298654 RepID=E3J3X2_PSEI1|nr:sigma-70 family RNA polymerase sigma factor [Pseudofrankia inefficax]ADP80605.1 RNA polymerase, sigma-24 subunit, ECF subfamily [Pseudofrankia inefficax]